MMMNKPRIVVLSGTGISIWYAQDDRIVWDTYLVTLDGCAIGFTNGDLK